MKITQNDLPQWHRSLDPKIARITVHQTNKLPIAQMPHPHYHNPNKGDPKHNNFLMEFLAPTPQPMNKIKYRVRFSYLAPSSLQWRSWSHDGVWKCDELCFPAVYGGKEWILCTHLGHLEKSKYSKATFQRWCRHRFHPSPVKVSGRTKC